MAGKPHTNTSVFFLELEPMPRAALHVLRLCRFGALHVHPPAVHLSACAAALMAVYGHSVSSKIPFYYVDPRSCPLRRALFVPLLASPLPPWRQSKVPGTPLVE